MHLRAPQTQPHIHIFSAPSQEAIASLAFEVAFIKRVYRVIFDYRSLSADAEQGKISLAEHCADVARRSRVLPHRPVATNRP